MGIGSNMAKKAQVEQKHVRLHKMLQMASSTSVPVSGVSLSARTG